mmetsp:Transcript_49430/g.78644  ORF Transcript_49430/g.78644 Transcript_49430/m.78644 type:complete len:378 (-) Transcript_49430:158-1291(-)
MQKSRFDSRVNVIKAKFKELDKNSDNMLDFAEMRELLLEERPDAKDRELKWMFSELDKGRRGKLNFSEFVDFIYKKELQSGLHREARHQQYCQVMEHATANAGEDAPSQSSHEQESAQEVNTESRRCSVEKSIQAEARLNGLTACESEGLDWEVVEQVFFQYAGLDKVIQGNEFARLCRDCSLFDEEDFTPGDADYIFHRCCAKDRRVMKKKGFREAIIMIARMKNIPAAYLRSAIAQKSVSQQQPESLAITATRLASAGNLAGSLSGSIATALRSNSSSTSLGIKQRVATDGVARSRSAGFINSSASVSKGAILRQSVTEKQAKTKDVLSKGRLSLNRSRSSPLTSLTQHASNGQRSRAGSRPHSQMASAKAVPTA